MKHSSKQIHAVEHIRNIALDIVLSLLTCSLWSIYVQHAQMKAVNTMIGREKYSFLIWLLLTMITCGLYHFYHEYQMSRDICIVQGRPDATDPLVHLVIAIFSFGIITDAIQQAEINRYFGSESL